MRRSTRASGAVALIAFAVYVATFRPLVSMDATTNILVAYSFALDGTAYLDRWLPFWNEIPFWWQHYGDHVVSWTWYAPGAGIMAAPIAWLGSLAGIVPPHPASVTFVGRLAAALFAAGSVFFVHASAALVAGRRWAVIVAALYAFGTATWPTSAAGLWQHAPAQLAVAAGTFLVVAGRRDPRRSARSGVAFALAVVARPQNVVLLIGAWILAARSLRSAILYGLWATAPFAMLAAYVLAMYGRDLPPIAQPPPPGDILVGLAGNLVSPSRGIFMSSPFLIPAAAELVRRSLERGRIASIARTLALGAAGVLVVHAEYGWWWGGVSYLNRYLADALPVLALGLAFWARRHHASVRSRLVLGALAAPSVVIAGVGALVYEWRDALWEVSTSLPIQDLVWRLDRMQAWYALTTTPRWDAITLFGLGTAAVAAALLLLIALRPVRRKGRDRGTTMLHNVIVP